MTLLSVLTAAKDEYENILIFSKIWKSHFNDSQFEWVIQDSNDSPLDCTNILEGENIAYSKCSDLGIYDALNKAFLRSSGSWILILGADDRLNPSAAEEIKSMLIKPLAPCILLNTITLGSEVKPILPFKNLSYFSFIRGMPLSHQSLIVHRSLLANHRFDLRYRYASDFEWLLYHYKADTPVVTGISDIPIANMSTSGLSSSLQLRIIIIQEFISILQLYEFPSVYNIFLLIYLARYSLSL